MIPPFKVWGGGGGQSGFGSAPFDCNMASSVLFIFSYYANARTATVKDFLNPKLLDTLGLNLDIAKNITVSECRYRKPIRLTETSSCYGGGAKDLSDAYVAGFM